MKSLIVKSKWLIGQFRPIVFHLILIVFLGLLTSMNSVYRAVVIKNLIDSATGGNPSSILRPLTILGLLIVVELVVNYVHALLNSYCSTKFSNTLQKRLYYHITHSEWIEGSKYHSGDLISRMLNDTSSITNLVVNTIPNILSLLFMIISSFILLLSYEPTIAFLTLLIGPIALLFSRFYSKKLKNIHLKTQENESKYLSFIQESINNILVIKTFCLEKFNLNKVDTLQNKRISLSLSRIHLSALYGTSINLGYWFTYFVTFGLGSFQIASGHSSFGTLTALLQLTSSVQVPLSSLASSLSQFITAYASIERLMEIEKLPLEYIIEENQGESDFIFPLIEYNNVSFSYKDSIPILKDLSFSILPGEIVALVGPSGEGKTTLIRLLLSLIKPKTGTLKIKTDNKYFDISPETRHYISYVPQGNTLFSGTIAENVRYGLLDATDKDIEIALKAACAWDFVNNLPDKTETIICEHGAGLSEGQAQRLVIARALIRKRPILILDEITSALDMDTEVKVLRAIENLDYHPTCIIITHRPSALAICDRILKLDNCNLHEIDINSIQESALGLSK